MVINRSSVNGALAITKQLTKVMAIGLAARGIRVMGIGPGSIATEWLKTAVLTNEAAQQKILSRTPKGHLGEPDEVAKIAVFLASDEASYLTGTTLYPAAGGLVSTSDH